ncbi:NUDIX hydrolase [Altericroceibacterium xinjiangense]|uniref:NUDIX hydrolase n=1 Tax=Altericroceibacterium xinjiangense TaxID=762261 RepID=UPI000F7D8789|nr:NUDIX domain-containing protein [Altericroceibacterium xinjiangense]
MLHLIPAPLHRLLYRAADWGRRRWLRWRGGEVHGCTIIAQDEEGRLLLVRQSYGSRRWVFPGGGIQRNEHPETGARREFAEELSCELRDVSMLGVMKEPFHGATNVVHVFTGRIKGTPQPDKREIIEVGFFWRSELPENADRTVHRRLRMLDRS